MTETTGRGGGWVVGQFALIGVIVAAALLGPRWPHGARAVLLAVGSVSGLAGVGIAVWAARALGPALTPFPRPAASGELVERGPYRVVRHPIYSGGLLFIVGISLSTSALALALTAALGVLWALKARVEEGHLLGTYPGYADYCCRVRFRIVPLVH